MRIKKIAEFPMAISQIDVLVCLNRLDLSEWELFCCHTLSISSMNVITFSSKWSQHFNSMDFQSFSSCRTHNIILFYFRFHFMRTLFMLVMIIIITIIVVVVLFRSRSVGPCIHFLHKHKMRIHKWLSRTSTP